MIKIYAPASIGNINVGFDILGAAISPKNGTSLGDYITITPSDTLKIKNIGRFAFQLPKNMKKNIVWKCWKHFRKIIKTNTSVKITLEKNMPIGSGLGSSACSIVATLVAMNQFFNKPLNAIELLNIMGIIEGEISGEPHYDNVAPSYYGGLQLVINEDNFISQEIPFFKNWIWIVAWPGINISTSSARSILPMQYDKNTCIEHSRLLSGFIHASHTQQENLAIKLMKDIIAEPYRMQLIPHFLEMKQKILNIGAINFGISGSGPTIFVICNKISIANNISHWLQKNYLKNANGFVHICELDILGARNIEV
ncbi:homoserine kinase [Buchnera aphidicola]|uniref:Homoserine kinase n=1 Tax=Buchnera aphidicola (Sarucallis kahawaluokalani) TaxID=1241878 RepID=A0A4D6YHW5_9GAMM|nr:homoserine kinase [Buchnera aphidicola]QCI25941.1 homoserine kinase [Buchnera aphidicola (Sarucallis kahawaluokalani)]